MFHLNQLAEQIIIDKMRDTIDTVISTHQYAYRPGVSITNEQELDRPAYKIHQTASPRHLIAYNPHHYR